jgi:general secretion pathway protein F
MGEEVARAMSGGELGSRPAGPITIDQLLALNQEIVALVRAGVPLERGLLVAARDLRGRLGRIAAALSGRLSRGESLVEALAAEGRAVPPLYRAVVEAGARSGRLPVALEGLARFVLGYSEARSAIGLALWYPLLVLVLAYVLFIGLISQVVPRFVATYESLGVTVSAPLRWLNWLGSTVDSWWLAGPILLVVVGIGWIRSGSAARFQSSTWNWLRMFPWMKSILANYEAASFSELLALLLEQQVSYPSALVLAAESTGNPRLTRGARGLAEGITRGEPAATAMARLDQRSFLPMLRSVLGAGHGAGTLIAGLHHLADRYRKRARYEAEKLAIFLPVILMAAIGAGATSFYALALFVPLVDLLRGLSAS